MQQREVALALAGPAVGHLQQPRELLVRQGARLAARDARRPDRAHVGVGADGRGEAADRGEVLGDRRGRAVGVLERVAVRAHRLGREVLDGGVLAEESDERAVHGGVGAARLR